MYNQWTRLLSVRKSCGEAGFLSRIATNQCFINDPFPILSGSIEKNANLCFRLGQINQGSLLNNFGVNGVGIFDSGLRCGYGVSVLHSCMLQHVEKFCTISDQQTRDETVEVSGSSADIRSGVGEFNSDAESKEISGSSSDISSDTEEIDFDVEYLEVSALSSDISSDVDEIDFDEPKQRKAKPKSGKSIDFTKIEINKLPTVVLVGRPNVGKSALFNRLIRRREALVYNTPNGHVTRDIREGVAKLGDLRFRVLDSAGLEAEATSGSVLSRTAGMTKKVLERSQFALFLIDARDGLDPMDQDVGRWLRKHASGIKTTVVMNKAELLDDFTGSLAGASGEAYTLGFGDPIALSAETGLGMTELYDALRPLLEDYVLQYVDVSDDNNEDNSSCEPEEDSKLPLQLAIVGRPNVGKSTLLNSILQEDRVLVGPEAGLTRDSIRVEFEYEGRTIYLVDTAGWLERTKQEKGPSTLSIVQSRKNLMRAHVVALVLDAEEIAKARRTLKHAEVVIARRAVEEGRGLVVVVNKMDLLKGKHNLKTYQSVIDAVPEEIQTVIPQVTGIPVVFVSALEGKGQIAVMRQIVDTYEKWCLRLPTARINRWLRKVMSRHSWKDSAAQPKIKYFTQVKARPPTFVAFVSGKNRLSDTDLRFLTKSLKEDFGIGGIPIRVMQRSVVRNSESRSINSKNKEYTKKSTRKSTERMISNKRSTHAEES